MRNEWIIVYKNRQYYGSMIQVSLFLFTIYYYLLFFVLTIFQPEQFTHKYFLYFPLENFIDVQMEGAI